MKDHLPERTFRSFAFGPFVFIPERQLLLQGETPVRIGSRALEILAALVERSGDLMSKRELMARVWPNTVVDECNLKVNMAALRRAIGDGPGTARYIATVTGRGYRFTAPVQIVGLTGQAPRTPAVPTPKHNLPIGTTRIFGREDAIDNIRRDLDGSRLVSVVGPGGIGKTTVALAVAEHAVGSTRDGVWLVDLALLKDPELVPNAIATAIGLAVDSAYMLATLCEYLREREMLLVLDSCEHVIDAVAPCVDRILADAAGMKILVTSREPLRMKGERVRRLPGLGAPPPSSGLSAAAALAFPAVQLFVDRATYSFEQFSFSDADAPPVAEICKRLDGLALAIELAATRIESFGVNGLLKQLDDRFRILAGRRAGPERHRTLTATLDWSYGLLPPGEAALLRAVSVFAGVFDVEGASAVSSLAPGETAEALAQLSAKSLLATDLDDEGVAYRLLETTRSYCLERLQLSGEDQAIRRRHAEHICAVLDRAAIEWEERPAREWGAYRRVLDDLRSSLAWAGRDVANRTLLIRLTVSGAILWNHFSLTNECRIHVGRAVGELSAVGLAGSSVEMMLQVSLAGALMFTLGPTPESQVASQRALDIAANIGDTDFHLRGLRRVGGYALFTGQHDVTITHMETFLAIAVEKDPSAVPDGEVMLAMAEWYVGRFQKALRRVAHRFRFDLQGLEDARFARFQFYRNGEFGIVLGVVQWMMGLQDAAARTADAIVEQSLRLGHEVSLCNSLAVTACPIALWSGHYEEAHRYIVMLEDRLKRLGLETWVPVTLFFRGALECAQDPLSNAGLEMLEQSIVKLDATDHRQRAPYFIGVLADVLAKRGRLDDAEETIQVAIERARAQNEQWCIPELLRISASILTARGRLDDAEALLIKSIAHAKGIGALSWQLRAANDLAKLWSVASRPDDARRLLQPIFSEFTEGFATRDLRVAAEMLA